MIFKSLEAQHITHNKTTRTLTSHLTVFSFFFSCHHFPIQHLPFGGAPRALLLSTTYHKQVWIPMRKTYSPPFLRRQTTITPPHLPHLKSPTSQATLPSLHQHRTPTPQTHHKITSAATSPVVPICKHDWTEQYGNAMQQKRQKIIIKTK